MILPLLLNDTFTIGVIILVIYPISNRKATYDEIHSLLNL